MGFKLKNFRRCIENKELADKLSFLVNYFNYAVESFHENDTLLFETYLTLTDKIIFQIETNIKRSGEYIKHYFNHKLFEKNNPHFIEQKYYDEVLALIKNYNKIKKDERINFLLSNLTLIKKYRTYLRKTLFNYAIKSIKEYIFCDTKISRDEIMYQLEFIVATLYYSNYSKKDLLKVMDRIIFKNDYPFPDKIKKEQQEAYLKNLNFASLFDGFKNLYRKKPVKSFFIFKIENIKTGKSYFYKYNDKISFYNSQHPIFNELKEELENTFFNDFFDNKDGLFGVIKISFINREIAKQDAIKLINDALYFLNSELSEQHNANVHTNPFYYIETKDLKTLYISRHTSEKGIELSKFKHLNLYDNNMFEKLKKIPQPAKYKLLENEHLFFKAKLTKNPIDYWQYLETLFYPIKNIKTGFNNILSSDALTNYEDHLHTIITNILFQSKEIIHKDTFEIWKLVELENLEEIKKEISHPFIQFLIKKRIESVKNTKVFYKDIILTCKSQRNSLIHSNTYNEIEMMQLQLKFHHLFKNLRRTIIDSIKENPAYSFEKIIEMFIENKEKILLKT